MLEVINLGCQRGDRTLFSGLSFSLHEGAFALITGRNGCGKTTLMRTLCGLSQALHGTIRWGGEPIPQLGDDYRQQLAYIGHHNGIHGELTARENLRHSLCLSGGRKQAIDATLDALELTPYRELPSKLLSQGQKRRLALARLLLSDKPLWVMDEPFTALDATSTRFMEQQLEMHLSRGGMAILSSHHPLSLSMTKEQQIAIDQLPN